MVDSPFIKGYLFTIKKIQMKNYFLFFLLTIIALAYACNESDYDPTEDLETRSSVAYGSSDASTLNTSSCFPELCPTPPPIVTPGPWPTDVPIGLTSNPPTQIVFKSGSLDYTLQATGGYSDSREYTLVTDEAVYVLTDSQSEDLSEIKESTYRVPKCIYKVFDMDYSKMLSGEASVDDFASVYEGQEIANQQENGRIVVNISSIEIDECDPPQYAIRTIDWCEQRLFATTNRWMSNMTSNIGMDDFTTPVVRGVISKAVEECAAETDCYDCIDPRCILDNINQADIGSSIKDQINTNYVNLIDDKVNDAYDIDPGTVSTTAMEVKEFLISEDCNPTVISTCGDEIDSQDFVNALSSVNPANVDELINQIASENDIIVLTNAFKECSSLLCVFNTLKNNNVDLFCSTIDEGFISNPLSDLELDVSHHVNSVLFYFDKFATPAGEANAATSAIDGSDITIVFNKDRCSDGYTSIEFVRTLMHEAIHAKMFSDCWPEGATYDEYRKGFLGCLQEHYLLELGDLPEDEQHIAMSNIFVEDIAEAINQYLGGNGSWEDYEYLAWQGLSQYPDYSNQQWFSDHLKDAKERYESNTLPIDDPCDN